ncbi:MAG: hypothetical protein HOG49_37000 [Candidatus Scalindua sp.]|jgi:hypothetical protein|nr:hypothetical protein [Candidatus Scalindua sp.]
MILEFNSRFDNFQRAIEQMDNRRFSDWTFSVLDTKWNRLTLTHEGDIKIISHQFKNEKQTSLKIAFNENEFKWIECSDVECRFYINASLEGTCDLLVLDKIFIMSTFIKTFKIEKILCHVGIR